MHTIITIFYFNTKDLTVVVGSTGLDVHSSPNRNTDVLSGIVTPCNSTHGAMIQRLPIEQLSVIELLDPIVVKLPT